MKLYEGINRMLKAIGETPITSDALVIEADSFSDIGMARDTLLEMSKIVQQEGYWFNTEVSYPLVPTIDGYIAVGDNILAVNSSMYIIKDHKLYDVQKRTFLFDKVVTLDVVFETPFDDLPFVAADYISREATVSFYNNIQGDSQELRVLEINAQKAQITFQKAQYKHKRANLMRNSRLIDRTQNPRAL